MKKGNLVISLDFELLWGVFDKVDPSDKEEYFNNTRQVIPEILKLFENYKTAGTWATVGMLFNENLADWKANQPKDLPQYDNQGLSPYHFMGQQNKKLPEKMLFAKDLIQKINGTARQEMATHTYSHYYCLENGQNIDQFKADLKQAISLAQRMNVNLKSLVFPRNQFNPDYLKACFELGIKTVRSNPSQWYWQDTTSTALKNKLFRTGDAYFGKNNKSYRLEQISRNSGELLCQPASRFLRPISGQAFLNNLRLKRIKSEMTTAAKKGEVYHLWWHPHNFGDFPEKSLEDLSVILKHFDVLREKYDFSSKSMSEIAEGI
jgi:hypothetical protein